MNLKKECTLKLGTLVAHTMILATWKAEIQRIKVLAQPGK
jgi:hypothetical protein